MAYISNILVKGVDRDFYILMKGVNDKIDVKIYIGATEFNCFSLIEYAKTNEVIGLYEDDVCYLFRIESLVTIKLKQIIEYVNDISNIDEFPPEIYPIKHKNIPKETKMWAGIQYYGNCTLIDKIAHIIQLPTSYKDNRYRFEVVCAKYNIQYTFEEHKDYTDYNIYDNMVYRISKTALYQRRLSPIYISKDGVVYFVHYTKQGKYVMSQYRIIDLDAFKLLITKKRLLNEVY